MKTTAYYLRTSHKTQNEATQTEKIQDDWRVYCDFGISGKIAFSDRRNSAKLLKDIEEGLIGELVVMRCDRLGRNLSDILKTVDFCHKHKVPIRSLNEGIVSMVDGKVSITGMLFLNILSTLAEFNYEETKQKVFAGIELAKLQEKYKGRRIGTIESKEQFLKKPKVKKVAELIGQGVPLNTIIRTLDASPNFVQKVKKALSQAA